MFINTWLKITFVYSVLPGINPEMIKFAVKYIFLNPVKIYFRFNFNFQIFSAPWLALRTLTQCVAVMERLIPTNVSAQLQPARIHVPISSVIGRDLVKVKFEIFTIIGDNHNL